MLRVLAATALLGLVLAAGAGASAKSTVYLTVQVGSFDAGVSVDPPSSQTPECTLTECRFAYPAGTVVTMTAAPTSMSPFVRWSNGCSNSGSAPVCTRRLDANRTVLASFSRLTVHYTASKGGTVRTDPRGGNCGDGCDVFDYGATTTIWADPAPGYHVGGWSGACDGGRSDGCKIPNLTRNKNVYVWFNRDDGLGETSSPVGSGSLANISVSGQGSVSGQVAAQGFRCGTGSACKIYPDRGSTVAITASAATGWRFDRWTGRCSGRSKVCLFMNQPWPSWPVPSVQASFVPA